MAKLALLEDRGVVEVAGADAAKLLQGVVTNDLDRLQPGGALRAALLTPQGKILFDFFIITKGDGFLLETGRVEAPGLARRLQLYKLRAAVSIVDLSAQYVVAVAWDGSPPALPLAIGYGDPRHAGLGTRLLLAPTLAAKLAHEDLGPAAYHAQRVALGIAEAGYDFALGDTFPHEANLDTDHGVSFSKGCYVGQEVVARMHNKTVVRKRVARIDGAGGLTTGTEVKVGEAAIGAVGTVAGRSALAMLRLDRVAEAIDKGLPLSAGGVAVTVVPEAVARYRASLAERQGLDEAAKAAAAALLPGAGLR